MLVGDSIMRNQWESLVCLVQGVVPTGRKRVTYNGPSMAFHAMVRFYIFNPGLNSIPVLTLTSVVNVLIYRTLRHQLSFHGLHS